LAFVGGVLPLPFSLGWNLRACVQRGSTLEQPFFVGVSRLAWVAMD
jgi:hypothetical protein